MASGTSGAFKAGVPSATGSSVTFTATISPSAATGSVEFFDGANSLGTSPVGVGGLATLVTSIIALFLVLKKPSPVAPPQPAATAAVNAQSFQQKVQQLDQPKESGQPPAEVHLSSSEVSAALAQAAGQIPLAEAAQALSGTLRIRAADQLKGNSGWLQLAPQVRLSQMTAPADRNLPRNIDRRR